MAADPNKIILTGENPFIRLSPTGGEPFTTNASFWRIITCPAGPGHVLYLKSELTGNQWRIYSDNIAMARWLQQTVQGMLNPETADVSIPVQDAAFSTIPRLAAFLFGFLLLMPWMLKQISAYSIALLGDLSRYAR